MRATTQHRPSFFPTLECLEGRWVPAVTARFNDGELFVKGDDLANAVSIVATNGRVTVTSGTFTRTFRGVEEINVDLRGGADTLTVDFSAAPGRGTDLDVQTGAGRDNVTIDLGTVFGDDDTEIDVDLGGGRNTLSLTADAILADGELSVEIEGGNGPDDVTIELGDLGEQADVDVDVDLNHGANVFAMTVGTLFSDSELFFNYEGGDQVDDVTVELGDVLAGAFADLSIDLLGGDDVVTVIVGNVSGEVDIFVDGGDGFDRGFGAGTGNINVELEDMESIAPAPVAT